MKKKKLIISILTICLFLPLPAFSETIVLKSGKTVEGKLIEKTDKYIKIDFQGVPLTFYLDEIENIDGKSLAVTEATKEKELSAEEPNLTAKDSSVTSFEANLDDKYTFFDVFKIRLPRGWPVSQEARGSITQIKVGKLNTAGNFIGFIIYYSNMLFQSDIFNEETIDKIKKHLTDEFRKSGFDLTNIKCYKTNFSDVPAIRFDAETIDGKYNASQILFYEGGLAFTIVIATPISQIEDYNTTMASLNTWKFEASDKFAHKQNKRHTLGIIFAVFSSFVCYFLARIKNRRPFFMWAILGLLLSFIIIIILLLLPKKDSNPAGGLGP